MTELTFEERYPKNYVFKPSKAFARIEKMDKSWAMPIFCFTIDLDWAKEEQIEETLHLFEEREIPLTPFITHKSEVIEKHYANKREYVGWHPNFHNDSTQGKNIKEILFNLHEMYPYAKGWRSHRWFQDYKFSKAFADLGCYYDSTVCMFLHANIQPYQDYFGVWQLPVFFEDRFYMQGLWSLTPIMHTLKSVGLKVFDFHPLHICENDVVRKFLVELLEFVKQRNYPTKYLLDLCTQEP